MVSIQELSEQNTYKTTTVYLQSIGGQEIG
jgi:hypothetical protein